MGDLQPTQNAATGDVIDIREVAHLSSEHDHFGTTRPSRMEIQVRRSSEPTRGLPCSSPAKARRPRWARSWMTFGEQCHRPTIPRPTAPGRQRSTRVQSGGRCRSAAGATCSDGCSPKQGLTPTSLQTGTTSPGSSSCCCSTTAPSCFRDPCPHRGHPRFARTQSQGGEADPLSRRAILRHRA
jgi:hypothetical protein